ncbi:MAG: hypothetical protein ABI868_14830 [Acidobacteriota bacterium]
MGNARLIRLGGAVTTGLYAAFIVWVYVNQPRTMAQVAGGVASTVGAYRIDQASFAQGISAFRGDRFPEARAAFERADPAEHDPRTQFYIAYSYYRQGFGRVYNDDALFRQGLDVVNRALAVSSSHVVVDDPNLGMHSAAELKAELERGLATELDDLNPLRLLRARK